MARRRLAGAPMEPDVQEILKEEEESLAQIEKALGIGAPSKAGG